MTQVVIELSEITLRNVVEGNEVNLGEIAPGIEVTLRRRSGDAPRKQKPPEAFVGEALT